MPNYKELQSLKEKHNADTRARFMNQTRERRKRLNLYPPGQQPIRGGRRIRTKKGHKKNQRTRSSRRR